VAKLVNGFDYRTQAPCARTRAEWLIDIQAVLDSGGHVKPFRGERLVYGRSGRILFEIYDRDNTPQGASEVQP
jgi:hypothetical protein